MRRRGRARPDPERRDPTAPHGIRPLALLACPARADLARDHAGADTGRRGAPWLGERSGEDLLLNLSLRRRDDLLLML